MKSSKPNRLDRALTYCKTREKTPLASGQLYFAGTVDHDEHGFLKIEGYLFNTKREAQFEIMGRLKRAQRHMTLVFGEFHGEILRSRDTREAKDRGRRLAGVFFSRIRELRSELYESPEHIGIILARLGAEDPRKNNNRGEHLKRERARLGGLPPGGNSL